MMKACRDGSRPYLWIQIPLDTWGMTEERSAALHMTLPGGQITNGRASISDVLETLQEFLRHRRE